MNLRIKPGVKLGSTRLPMLLATLVVAATYGAYQLECTLTSGSDGSHMAGSLHGSGLALDFRLKHVPSALRPLIIQKIRDALGPDFDVVDEGDHLHVEYDPKDG